MKRILLPVYLLIIVLLTAYLPKPPENNWIRINLLGYLPAGNKVAVWCGKENKAIKTFQLVDAVTKKFVYSASAGKAFGAYGPFKQTYRLNFSKFTKPGRYYLQAGSVISPEFIIGDNVYKGAADFCLRYMRQQRTGFNPFLKDSCHTHDGYTLYGPMPDSTHIDVVGGWHDATDYLQYSTTSANATYHLLMAYRDFPKVFGDKKQANGLDGKNDLPDVLDEAKWGLDWLLKMHPKDDWMFNQIADDRDHMGMRIPKEDPFYGKGFERPVYFCSGEPQVQGKFKNNSTGVASTAGKFSSAFSLGSIIFNSLNKNYSEILDNKATSAFLLGVKKPGVCQTASVRSPYIYAEDNWTDDMELAATLLSRNNMEKWKELKYQIKSDSNKELEYAFIMANKEPVTPWLGADTAKHYQWYPFINLGHYELTKQLKGKKREKVLGYYKQGIQNVWNKAKQNGFYRGVPFIWCSNNLTTSFAIQCYWYRDLTGDKTFAQLEQANFDWLFGCNPWGTSMVYGLPAWGDTPEDPHSSFTHLKNYPIDGGLVDGPVYGSIYKNLIGINLKDADEYESFQSDLVVYHDDYGDYSTNEPTMDGTASLIYLLAAKEAETAPSPRNAAHKSPPVGETFEASNKKVTFLPRQKQYMESSKAPSTFGRHRLAEGAAGGGWGKLHGAIIRGDSTKKKLAIVFTGDEFADGGNFIRQILKQEKVKASLFLTGRFYRNPAFRAIIQQLKKDGHYLGAHSNEHMLYCDWNNRDSLLVTKQQFTTDLWENYVEMEAFGVKKGNAAYFLPPYEWYNDSIAAWTKEVGLQLINFTPGTKSTADYTTPEMKNYRTSDEIWNSIWQYEKINNSGLNGFILLLHIGTDPARENKFYHKLPQLIKELKIKGYQMVRINGLFNNY